MEQLGIVKQADGMHDSLDIITHLVRLVQDNST
jgi:hypothetical protein